MCPDLLDHLTELVESFPLLINKAQTEKGKYGSSRDQLKRLEKVKEWDYEVAVKSCSWGKFQTMGAYYHKCDFYKNVKEFEEAMNLCELQHFQYFKVFLKIVKGAKIIQAMKNKNWRDIAKYYNGLSWESTNPTYADNLEKYYNEFKKSQ